MWVFIAVVLWTSGAECRVPALGKLAPYTFTCGLKVLIVLSMPIGFRLHFNTHSVQWILFISGTFRLSSLTTAYLLVETQFIQVILSWIYTYLSAQHCLLLHVQGFRAINWHIWTVICLQFWVVKIGIREFVIKMAAVMNKGLDDALI